jgi:hypothetical protein
MNMLPFLKPKQASVAGLIIKNRTPDKPKESEELDKPAEDCAQALITAIHAQDKAGVIGAMKELMESLKSEPKEDAEPHSYEAQNAAAAKGND